MQVTLNIGNDQELRSYIKDCIKGQVLAIVREDFEEMVKNELERKLKNTHSYNFDTMLKTAMVGAISAILYKEHGVSFWSEMFIQPIIEKQVKEAIRGKSWDKLVDELAKEKVRNLIR